MYGCPHILKTVDHLRKRISCLIRHTDKNFIHNLFFYILEHIIISGNDRNTMIPFSNLVFINDRNTCKTMDPVSGMVCIRDHLFHTFCRCDQKYLIICSFVTVNMQQIIFNDNMHAKIQAHIYQRNTKINTSGSLRIIVL